ncbi:3-carboxy-cis,cis-muconate cycloisomerase [Shimia isoporae]|uniref:3-carboxy-cis,cis-muconate cycloisomerase n=1 Tax=Shimia isoporae TaxID=647720 RepID=A0A4R1NYC8_9RHOB|nr:3-carboxy-cis,cis-muconate cycloisomerase [Shimia isoporae]TCL10288.1 3-carboxy-cis,cis-muconate cycloisomerase [Shimia isoporae]
MTDVFTHPWLGGLFDDEEIRQVLSAENSLSEMIAVENAYTEALAETGIVHKADAAEVRKHLSKAAVGITALRDGTAKDGLVIPTLVSELAKGLPDRARKALHKGMTSQDVIDTALVLSLRRVLEIFEQRLTHVLSQLSRLDSSFGQNDLIGRTRMQAALPIQVADRLNGWRAPFESCTNRYPGIRKNLLRLQLGGAVGDRTPWGEHADQVANIMAVKLDLENAAPWHTDRTAIADFTNWLSLLTGGAGKIGQDLMLMSQQGIDEVTLSGGGSSSAMPHKQNPIQAEVLVALAQYNAIQLSGMHMASHHEQERSGTAWTLEWMILPQMVMATGSALMTVSKLLANIERLGTASG